MYIVSPFARKIKKPGIRRVICINFFPLREGLTIFPVDRACAFRPLPLRDSALNQTGTSSAKTFYLDQ
jgi:hypothetical protein